jgi:EmrB/QacA subfamily drug resistance transporter
MTFIDGTVVNVALPVLQRELKATVGEAQWVVESYALMLAALLLTGGALGDRYGRRKIFSIGVVLFALASVWCGLAPDMAHLVVARAAQGVGAALLVPGSLAIISASFEEHERGRAIGTWSGFSAIAAGVGPVLGGWLIENVSWRWIFFINVPLAVAVLLISWRRVPESRDEHAAGPLDWAGAALAIVGLGAVVFGLIEAGGGAWGDPRVWASLLIGVGVLVVFMLIERGRGERAMMPLRLFRARTFAGANSLTLFLYGALGGLLFFLPFNLVQVQRYSATEAGAALLPFVLTMFLLSRWAGGLVERYGSRLPLVAGPITASVGFALFSLPHASEDASYWTSFFPAVMVMSVGMAASVAPLTTTVMGAVEGRHAGIASGINNAVSRTAALLAIAVLGVVMVTAFNRSLDRRLTAVDLAPEARRVLDAERNRLAAMNVPESANDELRRALRQMIQESFIDGFRLVAWVATALGLASALVAWFMIQNDEAATTDQTDDSYRQV